MEFRLKFLKHSDAGCSTDIIMRRKVEKVTNKEDIAVESHSKGNNFTLPILTENAPNGFTLDLFKQYKRRGEYCDRDLIKIHDKALKKKDKGSKNHGLVYVDFQAGMISAPLSSLIKPL